MPDSENPNPQATRLQHMAASGYGPVEIVGGALAVVWLAAAGIYFWTAPSTGGANPGPVLALMAVLLPLVLIGAAVATFRSLRLLRAEAAELQATVDAMRNTYLASQQAAVERRPAPEHPPEPLRAPKPEPEHLPTPQPEPRPAMPLASFASRRDPSLSEPSADRRAAMVPAPPSARAQPGEDQPALALGTPPEPLRAPLTAEQFTRALDFPESPDDREGFLALRLALEDRSTAKLIRAAQDVLTLLAQEGIFMDDLVPDRARPEPTFSK